jgi:hypothetical protein
VRPFDSRKARRFARGEDWTFGSERKVMADVTRSSLIAILMERGDVDGGGDVRTRMAGGNLATVLGCGRSGIITCYLVEWGRIR